MQVLCSLCAPCLPAPSTFCILHFTLTLCTLHSTPQSSSRFYGYTSLTTWIQLLLGHISHGIDLHIRIGPPVTLGEYHIAALQEGHLSFDLIHCYCTVARSRRLLKRLPSANYFSRIPRTMHRTGPGLDKVRPPLTLRVDQSPEIYLAALISSLHRVAETLDSVELNITISSLPVPTAKHCYPPATRFYLHCVLLPLTSRLLVEGAGRC